MDEKINLQNFSIHNIVLFDSTSNIEILKNLEKDTLIITFDYKSHKLLSKNKIEHDISDKYLSEQDFKKIYKYSWTFSKWSDKSEISKELLYENINLGKLFYIEFHHYLVPIIKKFIEVIKIFNQYKASKFFTSYQFYNIVKLIIPSVNLVGKKQKWHDHFLYDSIKFQFTDSLSINIPRKYYSQLKKISETVLHTLLKEKNPKTNTKSILLVEFDPLKYEKFFKTSNDFEINLLLFNRRRPVIWNKKSFSIIKNSNCRTIATHNLIDTEITKKIEKTQFLFEEKIKKFDGNDFFTTFFSIDRFSFWSVIKQDFLNLCKKRILESINEIEITKKLFEENKISCVLILSESGFNEQIVIGLTREKKIPTILIQHGLYWETLENRESDEFEGIFPNESDKFLVWGKITEKYAIDCGYSKKTENLGSLIHDKVFDLKNIISNNKKNYILLATSSPATNEAYDLTVKTLENYEKAIETICKTVSKMNKKLIIKFHPFQEEQDIEPIVKMIDKKIVVKKVGNILPLVESCEIFLTIDYSTTMLEALILNKPIISIHVKDRSFKQLPPIFDLNACIQTTIENFETTLTKVLDDADLRTNIIKNGQKFVDNYLSHKEYSVQKTLRFLENVNK